MTIHQCPKCELKFAYKTELDDHCWHDHPTFQHDYPASVPPPPPAAEPPVALAPPARRKSGSLVGWLSPKASRERHRAVPPTP